MRNVRMLGVALVAALTALAIGAVSASAALPEFGECTKASTPKTGEYTGPGCTKVQPEHKGAYNWKAGPPAKPKFEILGENTEFETTTKRKIVCSTAEITGEYTSAKAVKEKVLLLGCSEAASTELCSTKPVGGEGEIEGAATLEGELGFIKGGEHPQVGIDLKPPSPATVMYTFTCGNAPKVAFTATVEGSVIGTITPFDKMAEEFKISYAAKNGVQRVQKFEGGAIDTLSMTLVTPTLERKTEVTAFKGLETLTSEVPLLEIKAKTL